MSFGEKIASIMERPGQDPVNKDDVPWYLKYAGRGVGTGGGFIAIFLGAWNCIGILLGDVSCLISGMWQMVAGFLVIIVEAPCCCMFLDFVQSVSDNVERRPYWNRAAGYCIIALPAIFLCPGVSSILGSGLIFGAGVIYGLMSIGKKGQGPDPAGMGSPSGVVSPPPGTGPTDHHTTLMEDPDVWRPT
ncbi:calcium channel flower isoform X1 [Diachasma alloeum]|uniref:calcium channel flower isoform X1 n=1 Tax=Diachasma alloeum TaxID=454923 RepID=UPI0007381223|nr:calcium channel flower isoform X1 [Diachasma alloeum]